jgi:hypothetical protein
MSDGRAVRASASGVALAAFLGLLLPCPAQAQTLEPPPETPEGADYVAEPADSLGEGYVEIGLGAAGRAGGAVRRRRRVRFADDELRATVRDGAEDPLAGAAVERERDSGGFVLGRLAPRWGRGLMLGAPAEPWQRTPEDRGVAAAYRGRAGEGIWVRRGARHGIEALAGRFGRRHLGGARAYGGPFSAAALAQRAGGWQGSLAWTRHGGQTEIAIDRSRRWRAEGLLERRLGDWSASGSVRAGSEEFRSLAEPGRAGPARSLGVALGGPAGAQRLGALAALWSFRPGVTGARAAFELERPLADGAALALGLEEQHGVRRDRVSARAGLRQGGWIEWRSAPAPLELGLRQELWGERALLRGTVRAVSTVRLEAAGPAGISFRVTHNAFRVRRGESLYLPEAENDRLVLRAVSGDGARTRIEARLPVAGGRVHAALHLVEPSTGRTAPQWTVDWSRRRRSRSGAGR